NSFNAYIGNDSTPIFNLYGMNDFAALNVADRTYLCPYGENLALPGAHLQVINVFTGKCRDAGGLAPEQSTGLLSAANSVIPGNVAAGVHGIAVIYQTDTGFWTPPGPKKLKTFTC